MSSQPRRRRLEVEDIGEVTVVNFTDKKILDEQNIQIIGEQLFSLVDDLGRRKLLLNFSNVEYLSSAALGKFITLNTKVNAARGRLILCNLDRRFYELSEITKLNKHWNVTKDEWAALHAFSAAVGKWLFAAIPPIPPWGKLRECEKGVPPVHFR